MPGMGPQTQHKGTVYGDDEKKLTCVFSVALDVVFFPPMGPRRLGSRICNDRGRRWWHNGWHGHQGLRPGAANAEVKR